MSSRDVFAKTEELKRRFGEFHELSLLINQVISDVETVNTCNSRVGGDDEIGRQYHDQVDRATKDLAELMKSIKETVDNAGENGINLAAELDYAQDTVADIMKTL